MPSMLCTGLLAALAGGGTVDVQPAVGQAYCITDVGSDQAFVGDIPDLSYAFRDAVLTDANIVIDPTTEVTKGVRKKEIYITNTLYLRITNTAAGAAVVSWVGHRVIPTDVRSRIVTAPSGGSVLVRPPVGEVWKVLEIGAETANATNEPDAIVRMIDGTSNASIIVQGTTDIGWDKLLNWYLTRDVYLSIAPIAAADNDIGLSIIRVPLEGFCGCGTLGAGATVAIQPAEGVEAVVTAVGGETFAGVAPAGCPDLTWQLVTAAATPSTVIEPGSVSDSLIQSRDFELEIDNTVYLQVVDTGGAGQDYCYSGYIRRREHTT